MDRQPAPQQPKRRVKQPPDPRYAGIRVDNHFFDDAIAPAERAAADRLIELARTLKICIAVPHTVRAELDHPNTPASTRRRAAELPFTIDTGMGNHERRVAVEAVMRGNAKPGQHQKDATHLYDAALWQCAYFVTCDARILKKQHELAAVLHDLWIVKPSELLTIYETARGREKELGLS